MFDRGYFDLKRLYNNHVHEIEAYIVIRQRGNLQYQVISESATMHNADSILSNQVIRLTETTVRIQICTALTAYCMVAIFEHDLKLHRSTYEVLRLLSASLLNKTPIWELFTKGPEYVAKDGQLALNSI